MPRKHIRSNTARPRATWSDEQLMEAVAKVQTGVLSKREAHRRYNVPARTLKITSGNFKKGASGPEGILGMTNETRLVADIHRLSVVGFAPDRSTVTLPFRFAEKLGIRHPFSAATEKAGFAWLHSSFDRNPELSVRQAEGLSLSSVQGMNREDARRFFELLDEVLTKNGLMEKPSCIFNMDETGVQLLNKPSKVITKKGVNRKPELSDGLPPGSEVYMNRKPSFINSELFVQWLVEQFIRHKPAGKCVLILDGHTSHSTNIESFR
ncbi:unnamed protein product [Acanthoscelides obtectus]|uniref:HTH psq-type domain-containing protein n=1 Tax=Acanthoscelides obtectus TaxID=200917 RepID=A0A9P0JSZ7_ACAOB|nr:unnamed protein product [Acanthoscelides obtectus]CAK1671209.1 hypothetical protein AOBTE_LOCUS28146 [Acanthoscelides obtectus]